MKAIMSIYVQLYRLMSIIMRHYESFITLHECVYNALWILGLKVLTGFLPDVFTDELHLNFLLSAVSFYIYKKIYILYASSGCSCCALKQTSKDSLI